MSALVRCFLSFHAKNSHPFTKELDSMVKTEKVIKHLIK